MSQASCIGLPQPKSWKDFREGCIRTFHGGYHEESEIYIFRHGMETVFNLLENEFPSAELCKAAPELLAALKFIVNRRNLMFAECSDAEEIIRIARKAISKTESQS